jgi:hypothetical protein
MPMKEKDNPLAYDNVFKADGRFRYYAELETVTIPDGGLNIGSLLKENAGKYEFIAGSPTAVLAEEVKNDTGADKDIVCPVCKSGAVLALGVTYAGADTYASVKSSLEKNHIDIIMGKEMNNG